MKNIIIVIVGIFIATHVNSQSANWKYFRPSNTGVGGEEHNFISGDRFGNIWTGSRAVFFNGEGSVVRFNHQDTIFTCWSDFEGYLPSDFVYDAKVDSNDVLWVATGEGLCKFDGINWTTYTTSNTPLPSDNIRSISFDSQNNVWISFYEVTVSVGGIAKFDGTNWTIYTPANSNLPNYECGKILMDSQNNKWIQSKYSVTKFDGLNFIDFNWQNSGLFGPQVYDIALDSADNLYALTDLNGIYMQLNVFDGTNWSYLNYTNTPAMSNYYLTSIYIKNDKMILAESGGSHAVILYDGLNWSTYFGGDMIHDVYIDKDDTFWVSGISTLSKLVGNQWKDYSRYSTALAEHNNNDVFVDSKNRKWFANGNGGIQVFDCPKWQSYGPWNQGLYPSPQNLSTVGSSICEDSDGNIWFTYNSTNGTVVKIPQGDYQNYAAWHVFDLSNSPVSWVESSIADNFGNVFFYSDFGVHMYNNVTQLWTTWNTLNSPLQNYSYGFGKDNNGSVYFSGFQQLAVYTNGIWTIKNLPALGAAITVANDIAFDSQNNMWLATEEGVWKYSGGVWTTWDTSNSAIVHNHVSSIVINDGDSVFISSYNASGFFYGGVSIFNGISWTTFTIANSDLPSEQIDDMEIDAFGNLWINTFTKGVTVYKNGGVVGFDCIDMILQSGSTTSLSEMIETKNQLIVYPNPANKLVVLSFELMISSPIQIEIADMTGSILKRINISELNPGHQKVNIDIDKLSAGLYLCNVKKKDGTLTSKIVKGE